VQEGEIVAILGPSGCGKTTLLRAIAGLQTIEEGEIELDGESISHLAAERRGIGMVFQRLALFPHLNVAGNLAFGIPRTSFGKGQRLTRADRATLITAALDDVGLSGFERRSIDTLSGGEAQRVALARSLLAEPRLLLLDEPLASLDRDLKLQLAEELAQLLHAKGISAIHVTHDEEEARLVADRLINFSDLTASN
jgi:ABC-type Fe3+/spermidine/putrescine transport system ATPase subunit